MHKNKAVYLCQQCKKIEHNLASMLFVEEKSTRSFCSDQCIETFFVTLIDYYEKLDQELRKKLNSDEKDLKILLENEKEVDDLLYVPEEVWCFKNDLGESTYSIIKKVSSEDYGQATMIGVCFFYANRPSFILFLTVTNNVEIINFWRRGEQVELELPVQENDQNTVEIDSDIVTTLEKKKSSYLADMLEKRSPADIPFESFHLYEEYLEQTMQAPDEVFKEVDEEQDNIFIHIKVFEKDEMTFYYLVLCYHYGLDPDARNTLIPVLTFPTLDGDLYKHYKRGEMLQGILKN